MTQAEEVVDALTGDCSQMGCLGRYVLNGKVFADYSFLVADRRVSDDYDKAWECDQCGSVTFDSCR